MSEDKKTPEQIDDKDLEQAEGGYSVWIGGSVRKDTGEAHVIGKSDISMAKGTTSEDGVAEFEDNWSERT